MTGCVVRNYGDAGVEIGSGSVKCHSVTGSRSDGISNGNGNTGILFRDAWYCTASGCTVTLT